MLEPLTAILLFIAVAAVSAALVRLSRHLLLRHEVLDRPNARSSHDTPTPRGGGLGLLVVLLPVWVACSAMVPATVPGYFQAIWLIPLAALLLMVVSLVDDIRTLAPGPRLAAQFICVLGGAFLIPGPVFQGLLPGPVDTLVAAIGWVWFINLFNFMDGIDGISGVEAIAIGLGIALIGVATNNALDLLHVQALVVAAAAAGFLIWNWHPARIFLGDSGSIPLGYLLGWLLLSLAASGAWHAAAILPLYYLADATITLFRRIARGEKPWEAHRDHFYQAAIKRGLPHSRVSSAIAFVNTLLVGLAIAAVALGPGLPAWAALLAAALLVAGLLIWLSGNGQGS